MSLFHRHVWVSISAQPLVWRTYKRDGAKVGEDAPITEVLQRCACGALRTTTLDGSWSFEQVAE